MRNNYTWVTTLWKSHFPVTCKKLENGVDRGPESDTACVPMQLNNGVYNIVTFNGLTTNPITEADPQ